MLRKEEKENYKLLKMSKRIQRVNTLIAKELGKIFLRDIDFPDGVLVTITRVETSSNLIHSKVYISVMPEKKREDILRILNKIIFGLQQKINRRLRMRPIPKINFEIEKTTKGAARVEELLEEIKNKEKEG